MAVEVYVHGLPGSAAEAAWAFPPGRRPRTVLAPWAVEDHLAGHRPGDRPAAITAFSLGAFGALRAAARHPSAVERLTLVSPAAPLELGDFLSDMAGAPVFRAAMAGSGRLGPLVRLQAAGLRIAPRTSVRLMFRDVANPDRDLLADPGFEGVVRRGMRRTLFEERSEYVALLRRYVRAWSDVLDDVRCPVSIVHGAADTWTPPAMAAALERRLGDRCDRTRLPGLGHYGALVRA